MESFLPSSIVLDERLYNVENATGATIFKQIRGVWYEKKGVGG
jgi:hypothetical protein